MCCVQDPMQQGVLARHVSTFVRSFAMSNESAALGSTGLVPMQVDAVPDVGGKAKDG